MLTETETDLRPYDQELLLRRTRSRLPRIFFFPTRLSQFLSTVHGRDGQSYLMYRRNGATCSLTNDPFFFSVFFSTFQVTFPPSAIVFATLESRTSRNSSVISESRSRNAPKFHAGRHALYASRLSQVRVTCIICCIKEAAYICCKLGHARAVDITYPS